MRALGIVRKMDPLGRIVIPKEFRDSVGWKIKEPLEMFTDGERLIIQSYEDARKKQEMVQILKEVQNEANPEIERKLDNVITYLESKG